MRRRPRSSGDSPAPLFARPSARERRPLADALRAETVGGLVLLAATLIALVWANSPLRGSYEAVAGFRFGIPALGLDLPVERWASEGALTLFFLVAGIELKRELVVGQLRRPAAAALPVVAAVAGMALPALVYTVTNAVAGGQLSGWAVPMATDIAFALGALAVVGTHLPSGLRAFLLTLAIVDDLGAILVIAVFYTSTLDWAALAGAAAGLLLFRVLHVNLEVRGWYVYVPLGVVIWALMYDSGVHATIAGVAMGMLLRVRPDGRKGKGKSKGNANGRAGSEGSESSECGETGGARDAREARETSQASAPDAGVNEDAGPDEELNEEAGAGADSEVSPAERVEHLLRPLSAGFAVPVFALFAAGVGLSGSALAQTFTEPESLGVVLGLFAGKFIGVFGGTYLAARFTRARLDSELSWPDVAGVAMLAGIGFTVSLLVAGLAFTDAATVRHVRAAVLVGSVLAAVVACVLLKVRNAKYRALWEEETRDEDRDHTAGTDRPEDPDRRPAETARRRAERERRRRDGGSAG